jgi:FkbM family methyltransferase
MEWARFLGGQRPVEAQQTSATIPAMKLREHAWRAAKPLLEQRGFELRRTSMARDDWDLYPLLIRLLREQNADVVFDVGANRGGFVDRLRGAGYEGRVISFEPLPEPFAVLARRAADDRRWDAAEAALSDVAGREPMRRSGSGDVTSSLLGTADALVQALPEAAPGEQVEVGVSTVDAEAAERLAASDRLFLKIDTQGNELAVLRGAQETLARTAGVLAELSLVELYEGQALFGEIVDWLAERGLLLLAMAPAFHDPRTGQLLQVDALFGELRGSAS